MSPWTFALWPIVNVLPEYISPSIVPLITSAPLQVILPLISTPSERNDPASLDAVVAATARFPARVVCLSSQSQTSFRLSPPRLLILVFSSFVCERVSKSLMNVVIEFVFRQPQHVPKLVKCQINENNRWPKAFYPDLLNAQIFATPATHSFRRDLSFPATPQS